MSETVTIDPSLFGAWSLRDGVILRGDVTVRRIEVARRLDGRVAIMEWRAGAVAWELVVPADVAAALAAQMMAAAGPA